ncbi:hypothetical protein BBP40_006572 [Aspergillus hancockii]|nr:hypothetical protein BBP40_006572 [Aspergillus hancockii]
MVMIEGLYCTPGSGSLEGPAQGDVTEQLSTQLKATQERLEEVEAVLNRTREQSARDIEIIGNQRVKIMELEDLIRRQKTTISCQSKTISGPKKIRVQQSAIRMPTFPLDSTPSGARAGSPRSNTPSSISPYPPNLTIPPPTSSTPISTSQGNSSALVETSRTSPKPPRSNLLRGIGVMRCSFDTGTSSHVLSVRLQNLFVRTRNFGQAYTNHPSIHFDSKLGPEIKDYIIRISDRIHASTLLGNPTTRFCVIAKAINYHLIHDILQLSIAKAFDVFVDLEINMMQGQITPDTPPVVRHLLLNAIAHQVQVVAKKPGFAEYQRRSTQAHMAKLWQLIGPLTQDPTNRHQVAWLDLHVIVTEAQALAVELYSLPLEWGFSFPAVNETFDPVTMVSCDQFVPENPEARRRNNRVRLGVTPAISIRDNSIPAPADVRIVNFANVLLRPPPRRYTQLVSRMNPK